MKILQHCKSGFIRLVIVAIVGVAFLSASASDLKLLAIDESFVFAGAPARIAVSVHNYGSTTESPLLEYRLWQVSSSSLAPISEKNEIKSFIIPPGQTTMVPLSLTTPSVRSITSCWIKISEGTRELGSIPLRVCPTNLLSGIKSLTGQIALFEPQATLKRLFEANGISVLGTSDASFSGALLIVRLDSKEAESQWIRPERFSKTSTIFIVSPRVTGAEKLLPIKFASENGRPTAVVQDWFIPDIEQSPLSQLRLLHISELVLKPALVKIPGSDKLSN